MKTAFDDGDNEELKKYPLSKIKNMFTFGKGGKKANDIIKAKESEDEDEKREKKDKS